MARDNLLDELRLPLQKRSRARCEKYAAAWFKRLVAGLDTRTDGEHPLPAAGARASDVASTELTLDGKTYRLVVVEDTGSR